MHWNTEQFIQTHELVQEILLQTDQDDLGSLSALHQAASGIMEDLKGLLITPTRSEQSREKLQKGKCIPLVIFKPDCGTNFNLGKLEFEGVEYGLNQQFVETAIQVSEELNIDELVAAELVFNSSSDLNKLDMSPLQGGLALFHVRRQYILDLIRCFLIQSSVVATDRPTIEFKNLVSLWTDGNGVLPKILDSLKSVEQGFVDLDEKEKKGQFLQIHNLEFVQTIKLRRDFLLREHDVLGQILCGLVHNKLIDSNGFSRLVERVKGLSLYNTLFVHYVPSLLLYLSTFDPVLTGTSYATDFDDAYKAYQELTIVTTTTTTKRPAAPVGTSSTERWNLEYWQGALSLALLGSFSGLCKAEQRQLSLKQAGSAGTSSGTAGNGFSAAGVSSPSSSSRLTSRNISYENSILEPARRAIDAGGVEFLMTLAADTSQTLGRKPHFYDYRPSVQLRVPSLKRMGALSEEFLVILTLELERLVEIVISNLADILKEMRLSEEDSFLSLTATNAGEYSDQDEEDLPGADLERFFIFISYLYSDRSNEASSPFWEDNESNLYGFLTWALQCHITFMSATLCDMLASLASGGPACANSVYHLLKDASSSSSAALVSANGGASSTSQIGFEKLTSTSASALGVGAGGKPSLRTATTASGYRLSWEIIFDGLDYYAKQLQPNSNPPPPTFSGRNGTLGRGNTVAPIVQVTDMPELDDDVLLLLWSYFRLITMTVSNDHEARSDFTTSFGGKNITTLFELMHSQTPLYGSILAALAGFAKSNDEKIRYALWVAVDNWAFNSTVYTPDGTVISPNSPPKERLNLLFRSPSDIVGLVTLLEVLMRPLPSSSVGVTENFPFPQDLGRKYRVAPGIWPYVDFVINEVFFSSASSAFTLDERLFLQLPCLLFIEHSLELLDPDVTRLSSTLGVNPDLMVHSPSFLSYLYNHPCAPTMSHLFNSRIYNILIEIVSVGIDEIGELEPDDPLVQAVVHSLRIINDILDIQQVFLDVIVKEFKTASQTISSTAVVASSSSRGASDPGPPPIVTHGLTAFEDVLLFNLPTVTHLALYIGCSNIELAYRSLQLLQRLSVSPQFSTAVSWNGSDPRVKKNRLLSTLETVDESIRIKEGFLEQLERPVESYQTSSEFNYRLSGGALSALGNRRNGGIEIKLALLDFIIANLKPRSSEPTTAHFLLGFRTTGDGLLDLDDGRCGIATGISAFNTILGLLQFSIQDISASSLDVDYAVSKMANSCMEILLLLVEDPLTSQLVLKLLRESDFALSALNSEPLISRDTLWDGHTFSSAKSYSPSAKTVFSFFSHRASLLEYISMEIHESAAEGSLSLVQRYVDALINLDINRTKFRTTGGGRPAVMLSLLDVLELVIKDEDPLEPSSVDFFGSQVLQQMFEICSSNDDGMVDDDSTELKHLLTLKGLDFIANGKIASLENESYRVAVYNVVSYFSKSRINRQIRATQLRCLRSWAKLALVLVNDAEITISKRVTFVLETFQTLVPKLIDYSSSDIEFAEVLASLLVSLQHIYQEDFFKSGSGDSGVGDVAAYDRSHALFRASLESIQTPLSTPELRADLYIICYQYLKSGLKSAQAMQILQVVRAAGDKLLEMICSDALSGEGVTRLVALVFLEVLFSLSSHTKSTFVQDGLVRYNLLLLLVKSIQRIDQEISNRNALTSSELFYEFKVFSATLCFLLQVARTRSGAHQIIQCGLFDILDSCQFLNIDLDVGIEISSTGASLDIHSEIPSSLVTDISSDLKVSFYDILIPVFQLLCAILLSMGAENEPVLARARQFLDRHQQLIVAVMKKDMLLTNRLLDGAEVQLQELVKLSVLLISLTEYVPNV